MLSYNFKQKSVMADLTTFNQDSDNLVNFTKLNLLDKALLIKTGQLTSERSYESTFLRNEDLRPRVDSAGDSEDSPIFKTSISKSKQKKVISMTSISRLSTPRRNYKSNDPPDLNKVKISALLYEITERTNQLAQPRSCVTKGQISHKTLESNVSKSMSRIIKLACPKIIHDSAPKPINFVSPRALKAIATQRIIELSQPRKNRCYKLPRCNTQMHRSCNLRIRSLSKSKQMDHSCVKVKLLYSSEEDKLDTQKLFRGSLPRTSNAGRDFRSTQRKSKRKNKSKLPKEIRKQHSSLRHLKNTNSNRSVVVVGLDLSDWERSRFSKLHGFRRKSSRITKGIY